MCCSHAVELFNEGYRVYLLSLVYTNVFMYTHICTQTHTHACTYTHYVARYTR